MNNLSLPSMIGTKLFTERAVTIYLPFVYGHPDEFTQYKMNRDIFQIVHSLIDEQSVQQNERLDEMLGTYEIKTNERSVLSIAFSNYAIYYKAAHGLTIMKSLTFDTETGKSFKLRELFKPDSNYIDILSEKVKKQISARNVPVFEPFTTIRPDQDFYIADKALVLYFQLYEITPYAYGFPIFPISVYELENIIAEDGPLAKMATNT